MNKKIQTAKHKQIIYSAFGAGALFLSVNALTIFMVYADLLDAMDGNYFYKDYASLSYLMIFICSCSVIPNIISMIYCVKLKKYRDYLLSYGYFLFDKKRKSRLIVSFIMNILRIIILILLANYSVEYFYSILPFH